MVREMIVGVHKPNLFPHAGWLEKARRCDRFVILSWAQFSPGNYHNRFRLRDRWYTMSVGRSLVPLAAKQYTDAAGDWERIRRRLPADLHAAFARFDGCATDSLVETNVAVIRRMLDILGIKTEIVMDYPTDLTGGARLVDLCKYYGATVYLSGPSGPKYMDMGMFQAAGVGFEIQEKGVGHGRAGLELVAEAI